MAKSDKIVILYSSLIGKLVSGVRIPQRTCDFILRKEECKMIQRVLVELFVKGNVKIRLDFYDILFCHSQLLIYDRFSLSY